MCKPKNNTLIAAYRWIAKKIAHRVITINMRMAINGTEVAILISAKNHHLQKITTMERDRLQHKVMSMDRGAEDESNE